jgi:hypothetical protein
VRAYQRIVADQEVRCFPHDRAILFMQFSIDKVRGAGEVKAPSEVDICNGAPEGAREARKRVQISIVKTFEDSVDDHQPCAYGEEVVCEALGVRRCQKSFGFEGEHVC